MVRKRPDLRTLLFQAKERDSYVLVVGLGLSGLSACQLFISAGFRVIGLEDLRRDEFVEKCVDLKSFYELEKKGLKLVFSPVVNDYPTILDQVALAVLSPGINLKSPLLSALRQLDIPYWGELELGLLLSGAKSVVVTGTNGKSTTTSLIANLLSMAGMPARLCGNIGLPISEVLQPQQLDGESMLKDFLVVEASSYQLESFADYEADIAVFMNLSNNHLARHGTEEEYLKAKLKLFELQSSCAYSVINADEPCLDQIKSSLRGRVVYFGELLASREKHPGVWFDYRPSEGIDRLLLVSDAGCFETNISGAELKGRHNRYNIAAAVCVGEILNIPVDTTIKAVTAFKPLSHRMELVSTGWPLIINDSKATTVEATRVALSSILEAYPDANVLLLLGGLSKGSSWQPLINLIQLVPEDQVKVVAFGSAAPEIHESFLEEMIEVEVFSEMQSAVRHAVNLLDKKSVLLFSPACASFDQFTDFEQRGNVFKSLVIRLIEH
ncbi:MAG: UDP-N-acetylmuramoyl-L-alanine--D-glutamate ligase [Candidatus Dadabacteria bacterium]|nr:MAG: UDP-N-acetylmuramoyl-L-alanine--D-glutamate ligase [Candidatus Dadabacteria bacterium]